MQRGDQDDDSRVLWALRLVNRGRVISLIMAQVYIPARLAAVIGSIRSTADRLQHHSKRVFAHDLQEPLGVQPHNAATDLPQESAPVVVVLRSLVWPASPGPSSVAPADDRTPAKRAPSCSTQSLRSTTNPPKPCTASSSPTRSIRRAW